MAFSQGGSLEARMGFSRGEWTSEGRTAFPQGGTLEDRMRFFRGGTSEGRMASLLRMQEEIRMGTPDGVATMPQGRMASARMGSPDGVAAMPQGLPLAAHHRKQAQTALPDTRSSDYAVFSGSRPGVPGGMRESSPFEDRLRRGW